MPFAGDFRKHFAFWGVLLVLACLRVCFADVLWSDEDYHMAAAIDVLHGKAPYRDFWYDKPPLAALYYAAMGARPGVLLRLWDGAYVLLCCFLAFRLGRRWWGEREGRWAALFVAFFTTFYLPAAVIPFAPDALLIAPHLAAMYYAREKRWVATGLLCGVGFWINVKAVFVAAACALWTLPSIAVLGAAIALGFAVLGADYVRQVWQWGFAYAPGSPVANPLGLAVERIAHWLGFHLSIALAWLNGAWQEERSERVKIVGWLAFSFAAVCLGNHFAPRYFLQMLPPLAVVGARGVVLAWARRRNLAFAALAVLLLIPLARFGPRYILMARNAPWGDIALDLDAQEVAARINALKQPGDTLFVWGYRPDVYVYARMMPFGRIWDSQPLTGVPADRHLSAGAAPESAATGRNFQEFVNDRPTFLVDGLGLLNEKLKPQNYGELRRLLAHYREIGRTRFSVIYRLAPGPAS